MKVWCHTNVVLCLFPDSRVADFLTFHMVWGESLATQLVYEHGVLLVPIVCLSVLLLSLQSNEWAYSLHER